MKIEFARWTQQKSYFGIESGHLPQHKRGRIIQDTLEGSGSDIICLTEAVRPLLPPGGYFIESEEDHGYPIISGRRKVLLWSKRQWLSLDQKGCGILPPGRFVLGKTETDMAL
jgi:hypothetical protein